MSENAGKAPPAAAATLPQVVVMGVCGCGKSVVGAALARLLDARFIEGDMLHPESNVERMANGLPLTDADRLGWLDAVGVEIAAKPSGETAVVAACSALKRIYRDRLRRLNPSLVFVHLEVDRATARRRVLGRSGHFMPPSLVESQFADLEPPGPGEAALALDAMLPVDMLAKAAAAFLNGTGREKQTG